MSDHAAEDADLLRLAAMFAPRSSPLDRAIANLNNVATSIFAEAKKVKGNKAERRRMMNMFEVLRIVTKRMARGLQLPAAMAAAREHVAGLGNAHRRELLELLDKTEQMLAGAAGLNATPTDQEAP